MLNVPFPYAIHPCTALPCHTSWEMMLCFLPLALVSPAHLYLQACSMNYLPKAPAPKSQDDVSFSPCNIFFKRLFWMQSNPLACSIKLYNTNPNYSRKKWERPRSCYCFLNPCHQTLFLNTGSLRTAFHTFGCAELNLTLFLKGCTVILASFLEPEFLWFMGFKRNLHQHWAVTCGKGGFKEKWACKCSFSQ